MSVDSSLQSIVFNLVRIALPSERIFILYLLSAFALSVLVFLYFKYFCAEGERPEKISSGIIGYIFDRSIFLHKSTQQDVMYYLVNGFIFYAIIAHLMIGTGIFAELALSLANQTLGPLEGPVFEATPVAIVAYTLVVVILLDFAIYAAHYLQHKIPLLWQFHKVHHSAEVLTPLTFLRMHPVDLFLNGSLTSLFAALGIAGFNNLTGTKPQEITILGLNVIIFAFYLLGYNLRHSHIYLRYPAWLSYILISPAQHQTHHSIAPRHLDRNLGLIFAFWDWIFGTLYVPKSYEKLEFGLDREEPNPFNSMVEIYLRPFIFAWQLIRPISPSKRAMIVGGLATLSLLYAAAFISTHTARADRYAPPSLHLEELTWTEVHRALESNHRSVIIPTGGTEQNGPHVVLGKHNYIIRHTAEEIARQVGQTLVAPVMAYVPEGDTGPSPSGHMRFSGTVSVPVETFEAVLIAAIESYRTHGFDTIYLVGESAGNQESQARMAHAMSDPENGFNVHHIADYYSANGQVDWLKAQGFSEQEIGSHAGIRDTSELMATHPEGVRNAPVSRPPRYPPDSNGDRNAASPEIGQKMLELKIQAAVRQITALR